MLKLTLTPNREDRPRYAVTVSYELAEPGRVPERAQTMIGRNGAATGDYVVAVQRVREWVLTPNGWRWLVTRVTELRRVPGRLAREWPRKLDREAPELEPLRRARIMALRKRAHVDETIGAAEPDWNRALQLREEAEAQQRAAGPVVVPLRSLPIAA